MGAPMWLVNSVFIVKHWHEPGVRLKVNGKTMKQGKDFRVGYEKTLTGRDLVIWLKMKTDHDVQFSIAPK